MNDDEKLFERLDKAGDWVDSKLFPFRWYLLFGACIFGFVAAIYF